MKNQQLQLFYANEGQREIVKSFMIETLREISADMAFDGEDTKGIKEANKCITKIFDKLEEFYGKIETPIINNSR